MVSAPLKGGPVIMLIKLIRGVTSQQDNDKTVSVSNTIRLAVSRRDDGALVTCEATHPALHGQRKITQHALNVHYPGAIVEAQRYVPYSIIGGVLAMLVFGVICVLIVTIWCSVRQKGSYLTHEASGLDEHGEVQEAFLNGSETREGKKEYLL
ncbi:UNVERIFIED_CONTAM: hypothetical protein FKN15_012603 [Acipenser sinensis]